MNWARLLVTPLVAACVLVTGCDDAEKRKNPFDPPPDKPKQPPPLTEETRPKPPPELTIDELSPQVGFSRVILKKASDREKLATELAETKEHWQGKVVPVRIDRKANVDWVMTLFGELSRVGAEAFEVSTDTRDDFPKKLTFTPQSAVSDPPGCSVVGVILADRATAIWKLAGGTASKRMKGFAGPDLTMTGDTIARYSKNCKESELFFVSANEVIEWGLLYDLAASTKKLDDVLLPKIVLLEERPVAGRKVDLKK
jgi:biopolymer transport protein ExbD